VKIEKAFWITVPIVGVIPALPPAAIISDGCIGMVLGEDELTKERKGYIGLGRGVDEEADKTFIAQHGQRINPGTLREVLAYLEPEKK
jgi:hypothetical protein